MLKAMFTPASEHGVPIIYCVPPNGKVLINVGYTQQMEARYKNRIINFSLPRYIMSQNVTIYDDGRITQFPFDTDITHRLLKESGKTITASPTETCRVSAGDGYKIKHGHTLTAAFPNGTLEVSWI